MTPAERKVMDRFIVDLRARYGARLHDVLIFGSRARGDARSDSDFDIAVILEDGDWRFWAEKMVMADLAYDALVEHGMYLQCWPLARTAWERPHTSDRRRFLEAIRREGRSLLEAA